MLEDYLQAITLHCDHFNCGSENSWCIHLATINCDIAQYDDDLLESLFIVLASFLNNFKGCLLCFAYISITILYMII